MPDAPETTEHRDKRPRVSSGPGLQSLLDRLDSVQVLSKPSSASDVKRIGTHSGNFHCDEALACGMLLCLPDWQGKVELIRTRDGPTLDKCDIVADVGGVYDPAKHRYDHHQREFSDTMTELEKTIKLSSAGLVYRHHGKDFLRVLRDAVASEAPKGCEPIPDSLFDKLYKKVYSGFIEHIDGIDNGVNQFDGKQNYSVPTTLSARVGHLNPRWNEDFAAHEGGEEGLRNARFREAMKLALREIMDSFKDMALSWWPARAIVENALKTEARKAVHPSGKAALLPSYAPWQSHLTDLEEEGFEGLKEGEMLYMLFPDSSKGYRIQAVGVKGGGFANRKTLPEPWRGMRDEKLSELSGIEGCVFVHAAGFIGGVATLEGVKKMAGKAIEWGEA